MGMAQAVILGILQGLTEFLPVSSSAHLVAAQHLMKLSATSSELLALDVALEFGTLVSILIVLRRSIWRLAIDGVYGVYLMVRGTDSALVREKAPMLPTALAVVIGTVPAGLAGILLQHPVANFFSNVAATGVFLICTGAILLASRRALDGRVERVGVGRGLLIGLAQVLALLPGISRSGTTIVAGCYTGLRRETAGRFSFLLAGPVMAGAAFWEFIKNRHAIAGLEGNAWPLIWGMLAAAIVGTVCLHLLLQVIHRGKLHWFAAYCIPAGLAMIVIGLLT